MATFIRYTTAQCIAALEALDADLADVAQQPSSSVIRGTSVNLSRTHGDLERERRFWTARLKIARRAGR